MITLSSTTSGSHNKTQQTDTMNKHIPNFDDFVINESSKDDFVVITFPTTEEKPSPETATDMAEAYALQIDLGKETTTLSGLRSDAEDFLKDYDLPPLTSLKW